MVAAARVWVPNFLAKPESDVRCAWPQQDAINAKNTQVARVLAKHADPKLAVPRSLADASGNSALAEAYFFESEADIPRYITWDAQLAVAIGERDKAIMALLVATETSPALLGLKEGAAPDAYKKMRLEAFSSMTKAARKSVIWTSALDRILTVAQKLEQTIPGRGYPLAAVGITLNDGIPIDRSEQASIIATLRSAGAMSRWRAIYEQLKSKAGTEAEVSQIDTESRQAERTDYLGNQSFF